jgi:methionyl-tRNA synthetase
VGDADFTVERLIARADDELANGLGNLVNRVVAMIHRYRDGLVPDAHAGLDGGADLGADLGAACRQASAQVAAALDEFDFRRATAAVWSIADEANRLVNRVRPWALAKAERAGGSDAATSGARLDTALCVLLEAGRTLGRELSPFLPDAAARITAQCVPGEDGRLPPPSPVFRRLASGGGGHAPGR